MLVFNKDDKATATNFWLCTFGSYHRIAFYILFISCSTDLFYFFILTWMSIPIYLFLVKETFFFSYVFSHNVEIELLLYCITKCQSETVAKYWINNKKIKINLKIVKWRVEAKKWNWFLHRKLICSSSRTFHFVVAIFLIGYKSDWNFTMSTSRQSNKI